MKIAVLGTSNFIVKAEAQNYLQEYTYQLVSGLVAQGHEVTYFGLYGSKLPCEVYFLNLDSIDWSYDGEISDNIKTFVEAQHAYFEVFKYLQESDFEIVQNISQHPTPVFTAQFLKIPTVTTLFDKPKGLLQSSVKLNQTPHHYYVALNHSIANAWNGHTKINEIIYCGINFDNWFFNPRSETNSIFYIGDILAENHIDKIIEAIEGSGFNLKIYGNIVEEKYFEKEIKPKLSPHIKFCGSLRENNYREDLQTSTISVITKNSFETSAYLVLESLSCGSPVVIISENTNSDYLPENCGIHINTEDPQQLRKVLVNATRKSRKDCREYVIEIFNYTKMIENYILFYNKILN